MIASAALIALGLGVADPVIGIAIRLVSLRITRDSWRTVRAGGGVDARHPAREGWSG